MTAQEAMALLDAGQVVVVVYAAKAYLKTANTRPDQASPVGHNHLLGVDPEWAQVLYKLSAYITDAAVAPCVGCGAEVRNPFPPLNRRHTIPICSTCQGKKGLY